MVKSIVLFFCLLSGIAFSQIEDSLLPIVKKTKIKSLKSEESKIEFLENIYKIDQGIRETIAAVESEFGRPSMEYSVAFSRWGTIDRFLFEKTIKYLEAYPYPRKEMGEIACYTPQLVFHHVTGKPRDIELKKKYFTVFYQAYRDDSISSGALWFYLNRLYSQIMDKEYNDQVSREEDQIEEMIIKLGLIK
jgi:hypothetical protein